MKENASRVNRCCLLISLLLLTSLPLFAQYKDSLGGNWNNPASATITNIVMDRLARRRLEKRLGVKPSGPGAATKATSSGANANIAPTNDASVHFRSTGTQLKTRDIANLYIPDAGPDHDRIFAILTAVLQEYEKGARTAGKPNDLALALSFFFATNASVYHDAGEAPDPQMFELRDTIAGALVEGNALNGVTDRQKQEMYEVLVLYTGLALAGYQEAKQGGDAANLKIYRQLAGLNLQAVTGISPDKITFTDQGLNIEREPAPAASVAAPTQSASTGAVSWTVLLRAYEDNEIGANEMYTGKRIRVSGPFSQARITDGQMVVYFKSPFSHYLEFGCFFPASQRSAVATLKFDQEIVVEGTCRGLIHPGQVTLENCVLR